MLCAADCACCVDPNVEDEEQEVLLVHTHVASFVSSVTAKKTSAHRFLCPTTKYKKVYIRKYDANSFGDG